MPTGDTLNYVLTDNSGATHQAASPPVQILITNVIDGSAIQIYDLTNSVQLAVDTVVGTTYSLVKTWTGDLDIRVRLMAPVGATAYLFYESQGTFSATGMAMRADQQTDAIYNGNGVDGSAVTGIAIIDSALSVTVDTGLVTWQTLYAYTCYWLSTEAGIIDEGQFVTAIDAVNYLWENFTIKNITVPSVPVKITGGFGFGPSGDPMDLIDTTGGTLFLAPPHVVSKVVTVTGGNVITGDIADIPTSGLTNEEHNQLMETLTESAFIGLK